MNPGRGEARGAPAGHPGQFPPAFPPGRFRPDAVDPGPGPGSRAAWVRYGGPIPREQLEAAVGRYAVAILQPWETGAAAYLRERSPGTLLLSYKCLSSVRDYEPGPVFSSGVSRREAEAEREGAWFARRRDGSRIQWNGYGGHWQMRVWDPSYRRRWVRNVVEEMRGSPFHGVMADNDVFDDYYGLGLPLRDVETMAQIRAGVQTLVEEAGAALNGIGRLLVPNIAESRREEGRWERHSAYGGGFEEVWLGWSPEDFFDPPTVQAQIPPLRGDRLCIARVPAAGREDAARLRYAVAALWVFGGGGRTAVTATAHDDYSGAPFLPEQHWELGAAVGRGHRRDAVWSRRFEQGWAAVNFRAGARRARVRVPAGLVDAAGELAPRRVTLHPQEGAIFRRPR